jgi:hypothetical protein
MYGSFSAVRILYLALQHAPSFKASLSCKMDNHWMDTKQAPLTRVRALHCMHKHQNRPGNRGSGSGP